MTQTTSRITPSTRKSIALSVNGKTVQATVDVRMTLAEFLREELGLMGTKVGCNRGECGSCTVVLDGNAVYSCSMLAVEAMGKSVLTVEGLARGTDLHPLQQAFIEHDALQCGYCTPGMLMSLQALLAKNPSPTAQEVRVAIDGNFCRCGSYPNIIDATLDVAGRNLVKDDFLKSRDGGADERG